MVKPQCVPRAELHSTVLVPSSSSSWKAGSLKAAACRINWALAVLWAVHTMYAVSPAAVASVAQHSTAQAQVEHGASACQWCHTTASAMQDYHLTVIYLHLASSSGPASGAVHSAPPIYDNVSCGSCGLPMYARLRHAASCCGLPCVCSWVVVVVVLYIHSSVTRRALPRRGEGAYTHVQCGSALQWRRCRRGQCP